ncbi:MAG: hypothetical protein Q8P59_06395 [Dehalococcoidia bacterium]|nr:hypothetical protein [Dehalococcoidia bacterium]
MSEDRKPEKESLFPWVHVDPGEQALREGPSIIYAPYVPLVVSRVFPLPSEKDCKTRIKKEEK